MDAQAIKNLGGVFQILGVLIVVWDLLNIHEYLGDVGRLMVRMRTWRVRVEAAVAAARAARGRPRWQRDDLDGHGRVGDR
jgi:hypothetical protein